MSGIDRREAIRRVSVMLGGVAFMGGTSCSPRVPRTGPRGADSGPAAAPPPIGDVHPEDIAFLDEVADTILPDTGEVARAPRRRQSAASSSP
jgi:hypothetical protein